MHKGITVFKILFYFSVSVFFITGSPLTLAGDNPSTNKQGNIMSTKGVETVSGKFDVEMSPTEFSVESNDGNQLGRMLLSKTYYGALEARGKGEMTSARTQVESSAGYVALEHVTGTLAGKQGSFVLMHYGIMHDGEQRLILEVVPDSGTDELEGLSGKMGIRIEGGQHYYDFEYRLNDEAN